MALLGDAQGRERVRGEQLRLYTGTYVLISRKEKKTMLSATTPCKPILRQVEEFLWLPADLKPSG